jgi:Disulphide bond corrector protein DsbC/AhpC/TSA family
LQRSLPDFERQNIAMFAMSYDPVEVLHNFAAKYGITYTLFSDVGSKVIRALGLLNEQVYEQHAAYGIPKQEHHYGVPYPGVFLLDAQGQVTEKRFQQSYRERETGVSILERGFGVTSSLHGTEVPGQAAGVKVQAYLDADTYRFFQRLWLTLDLTIEPHLHVYGQPIPEGFVPLAIEVAPLPGLVVGEPQWPTPRPFRLEGLDEQFYIYEGNVRVALPVTLTQEGDDQTLQVMVRYQACSQMGCFAPQTITLELPVHAADHIERPRRR